MGQELQAPQQCTGSAHITHAKATLHEWFIDFKNATVVALLQSPKDQLIPLSPFVPTKVCQSEKAGQPAVQMLLKCKLASK
jgi:hypothetical protein